MKDNRGLRAFLFKYLKGQGKMIGVLGVFFVVNIALKLIAPLILSHFVDSAKNGETVGYIRIVVLIYIVTILINMATGVSETYFAKDFGLRITNAFRKDAMKHFLSIDMENHKKWTSGEVITRLDEDVEGLFSYFYILIFKLISNGVLLVGVLIIIAKKNLMVSVAMGLFCVVTVAIFKWIQSNGTKHYVNRSKYISEFNGELKESVDNIIEIKTNGADEFFADKLNKAMRRLFKGSLPAGMMYARLWSASTLLEASGTILFLAIAVYLWSKGEITLGTVYLIYTYNGEIYYPLQMFRENFKGLHEAKGSLLRVKEMFQIKSSIEEGDGTLKKGDGSLKVENLSFSYEDNKEILKNISFSMNSGERLGIVGETGCGKTTLVKLISRLYEFKKGHIYIGGKSIKTLNNDSIRKAVSFCTQDVHLFHGTLKDNIALYDESISDEDIMRASDKLGLREWINKLPQGLYTEFDRGAESLSAGEAQLVSIIRLFLKDPSIVILDEISSRLDFVTEQRILSALDVLTEGRTVITIAHKGSALRWCTKVMVLEDGEIVQYCNKDEAVI